MFNITNISEFGEIKIIQYVFNDQYNIEIINITITKIIISIEKFFIYL